MSSVAIKGFDNEASAQILPQLTRLSSELRGIRPPGLIQAMLLRDRFDDAMLIVQWRSRNDMYDFVKTEEGQRIAEGFSKALGNRASDFRDYFVTWQTDLPDSASPETGCGSPSAARCRNG